MDQNNVESKDFFISLSNLSTYAKKTIPIVALLGVVSSFSACSYSPSIQEQAQQVQIYEKSFQECSQIKQDLLKAHDNIIEIPSNEQSTIKLYDKGLGFDDTKEVQISYFQLPLKILDASVMRFKIQHNGEEFWIDRNDVIADNSPNHNALQEDFYNDKSGCKEKPFLEQGEFKGMEYEQLPSKNDTPTYAISGDVKDAIAKLKIIRNDSREVTVINKTFNKI